MSNSLLVGAAVTNDRKRWWFQMPFGFFDEQEIQYISAQFDQDGVMREWRKVLVKASKLHAEETIETQIDLLESFPSRDTILVIWIMVLALAGRSKAGGALVVNGVLPYSIESLAALFRRPDDHIRIALKIFQELGMVTITETGPDGSGTISIPGYDERFLTDHRRRTLHKDRQRKYREHKTKKPEARRAGIEIEKSGLSPLSAKWGDAYAALQATGKFTSLTLEHLATVDRSYPRAELGKNFNDIATEARGVAGTIGSVMPWLRKAVSGLEQRIVRPPENEKSNQNSGAEARKNVFRGYSEGPEVHPRGWVPPSKRTAARAEL